jgi:hypothetical protein
MALPIKVLIHGSLSVPDPKEETGASVRYTETQDGGVSHAQETEKPRRLV